MPKYMLACGNLDGPAALRDPTFRFYLDSMGKALGCQPFVLNKQIYINMGSDITPPWIAWLENKGIKVYQG